MDYGSLFLAYKCETRAQSEVNKIHLKPYFSSSMPLFLDITTQWVGMASINPLNPKINI